MRGSCEHIGCVGTFHVIRELVCTQSHLVLPKLLVIERVKRRRSNLILRRALLLSARLGLDLTLYTHKDRSIFGAHKCRCKRYRHIGGRLDLSARFVLERNTYRLKLVDLSSRCALLCGLRIKRRLHKLVVYLVCVDPLDFHARPSRQSSLRRLYGNGQYDGIVCIFELLREGLLGHIGLAVIYLDLTETGRPVHMLLGHFFFVAGKRAHDLVAGIAVHMAFGLLELAHKVALAVVAALIVRMSAFALLYVTDEHRLFGVARLVVHMQLNLGKRAHERTLSVVAAFVVRVGDHALHRAIEYLLRRICRYAVLAEQGNHTQAHKHRKADKHRRALYALLIAQQQIGDMLLHSLRHSAASLHIIVAYFIIKNTHSNFILRLII